MVQNTDIRRLNQWIFTGAVLITLAVSVLGCYNSIFFYIVIGIVAGGLIVLHHKLYLYLMVLTLIIYILFSYGATNLGVNIQGFFLPLAEGVLLIGIIRLFIFFDKAMVIRLFRSKYTRIFTLMFVFFVLRVSVGFYKYGSIAIRDGSHYIEMLFFLVLTHELLRLDRPDLKKLVTKLFIIILNLMFVYSLLLPLQEQLREISPVISGFQYQVTFFGHFPITPLWLVVHIMSNLFLCLQCIEKPWLKNLLHIQNLISLTIILISSSRITLLTYGLFVVCFLFINKKIAFCMISYLLLFAAILIVLFSLNITIHSMRGEIDAKFIKNVILSCIGLGSQDDMVSGFNLRKEWIKTLLMNSSFTDILIGKGFGVPLTDFNSNGGVIVREPHNSIISVFGRMGIVILFTWIYTITSIVLNNLKSLHQKFDNFFYYLSAILVVSAVMNSLAEPFFEFTYGAVPFYCLLAVFNYNYKTEKNITQKLK